MGANKRICPNCGRKMKQQFIGLLHCKCGTSWRRDIGFFERTSDMVFALERKQVGSKTSSCQSYDINNTGHQSITAGGHFVFILRRCLRFYSGFSA